MRDDQLIRAVGILVAGGGYTVRSIFIGNGTIPFLGFNITPFGLLMAAVVLMALPETIDMLPFGPTRSKK